MHILIVKTSSLGDVVHTLPALTDAVAAIPGLRADWVVEETFADIPAWHPAVDSVIPVAVRRWRKSWWHSWRSGELGAVRQRLQARHYDLVIDAQGLLKSALLAAQARGVRVGLDRRSIKEGVSCLFYNKHIAVAKGQHAVQRVRQLFGQALGYTPVLDAVDYGVVLPSATASSEQSPGLVFLHGTTWQSKHWPEPYWRELARQATAAGYQVMLPAGSMDEQQRARRIAHDLPGVRVLDRCGLTELAQLMQTCVAAVTVDTGLGHLAAALNLPVISLYGATDPTLTGTFGRQQMHLRSDLACSPCLRRTCQYRGQPLEDETPDAGRFVVEPACYRSMRPQDVLAHIQRLSGAPFSGAPC